MQSVICLPNILNMFLKLSMRAKICNIIHTSKPNSFRLRLQNLNQARPIPFFLFFSPPHYFIKEIR